MMYPYASAPLDALIAAQTSVGLVLGGALWQRSMRPKLSNALLMAALALAIVAPIGTAPFAEGRFLRSIGVVVGAHLAKPALKLSAALATSAALLTRRGLLAAAAVVGEAVLWPITDYIQDCDGDLAAAYLAFFGLLVGLHLQEAAPAPALAPAPAPAPAPAWEEDLTAFALGTLAGTVVCRTVLHGWNLGPDEGANTFQASLFAKLRAYGAAPRCADAFRFYWVFFYEGRAFAQYTPGWPAFMTPFVWLGVPWLAGPSSLGLLAAGVMRLARRAAPPDTARVAGRIAAGVLLLGSTILINGGSRYPHVFVAAMFAWALEALCAASVPDTPAREQRGWGVLLGVSAGLLVSARPLDGAALGLGLLASLAHAIARRRLGWQALTAATVPFAIIGAITLVILRLEVGRWFATGYSLGTTWYPWNTYGWSLPSASEYRWGIPLAAGAYCWWPCSPAAGLAGLALVRGTARNLGLAFLVGCGALVLSYTLNECGRKIDFGYGPRYQLPCIVPMAVGTGVLLARLGCASARSLGSARAWTWLSALRDAGPLVVAFGGALAGVVLIAPLVYPFTSDDVKRRNWLHPAIDAGHLRRAVVFAGHGPSSDVHDLAENLPLDLYPDQHVVLAVDLGEDAVQCVRDSYPDRTLYRAVNGPPVQLVPY